MEESKTSVTVNLYYRGVSIMITKRDEETKILPLVISQMELIDWALDEKECKPSWNEETNKNYTPKSQEWISPPESLGKCPKCNAPMKLSVKGKPYCSALCWKE